jgi:SAM-dependent methyltransferase
VSDAARPRGSYTFRDSPAAAERLARVARLFEASTRAFLERLVVRAPARVLDLGCGPGHTTRLLASVFPRATVVGIDQSEPFLAEARRTEPVLGFVAADVTAAPLPGGPADLVYARFVLSHLPARETVLDVWFEAVGPGGVLVVEEPEWIETPDAVFRRYLEIAGGLVADRGGNLYAGTELGGQASFAGGRRLHDELAIVSPPTGEAATVFAQNLRVWRDDPWVTARHPAVELDLLADGLAARRTMADRGRIRWGMRQVAIVRA